MSKTLTFTAVFQANSLNYGEGTANISELKKFHRGDGKVYTFASRQSLRYDIVRLGNEWYGWNLDTVDKSKSVIQFKDDVTIADSVEMDLFGYLKTGKESKKRSAVARLSHAISMEPYKSDMEFLNNMGLAERIKETPNLANIEQHQSLYTYTLTVDLAKVGVDNDAQVSTEERIQRVHQLLEILKLLHRDIRGRRENLSPLFAIGGVYGVSNPFFMGKVQLDAWDKGWALNIEKLKETIELTWNGKALSEETFIGLVPGWLANENLLKTIFNGKVLSMESFFAHLKEEVERALGA